MRLQDFIPIGAFLLTGHRAHAQTVSSTVSAASPSGKFDAVAALAAYGVNISDFGAGSNGSAISRRSSASPYSGCAFSVSSISPAEAFASNANLKSSISARPSPCSTRAASRHKAHLRTTCWNQATGLISKPKSLHIASSSPPARSKSPWHCSCHVSHNVRLQSRVGAMLPLPARRISKVASLSTSQK